MIRLFFLLVGFCLAVVGGISLLAYLNLLTTGYQFIAYIEFIVTRIEFYLFIIGMVLIFGSLTWKGNTGRKRKE
ncbi:hypothetical protein [Halalkalibacter urbisdiaboli]|uniref:hypothetical protein n=1 Tax=Halalkalibacter urbisdiaboli TaxID=1960589 RepID=UPI000B44FFE2|nr:hypothetical protein [Halalkalibacter urbisdiaboli]